MFEAGGDVTFNEVPNGIDLKFEKIRLDLIPAGICNDLARNITKNFE